MAEFPELKQLSCQMKEKLEGQRISDLVVVQEKCLNVPAKELEQVVYGKKVLDVTNYGKWIRIILKDEYCIMLNLGMGADILYYEKSEPKTDKFQCKLEFELGNGFTCYFWWFGHFELYCNEELLSEKKFQKIGVLPDDKDFTFEYFYSSMSNKNASVKNVILNQSIVSGIGNVYIHDILYTSGVHPLAKCKSIPEPVYRKLYEEIIGQMLSVKEKKGLSYEKDFYGKRGKYGIADFKVAYRDGKKCPQCGKIIEKVKIGSTSSYICSKCQLIY